MKRHITPKTIFLVILVGVLVYVVWPHFTANHVSVLIGGEEFVLEVADTPRLQERGLGGRDRLEPNTGMLFVFEEPGQYSFWMKGMRFPLDIVWLNSDWCVVHIARDISPDTYPDETFAPPTVASYVIEVDAGIAASHGLARGACLEAPEL